MGKCWFTSDTHFGSERTLALSKRPFKSVEEMNNTIIDNWNKVISPNDTIHHLGDFGDFTYADQLNGKINLIKGNYDIDIPENVFKSVYDNGYVSLLDNDFAFMNHYPTKCDKTMFNLFGHVHKLCMVKRYGLNVGVDCHNFTPIDLETVMFYKNAITNYYDENVFN